MVSISDSSVNIAPSSLVGECEKTVQIRSMLLKLASSATTSVLLRGESGTGKNLAAKIIHYNGDRSKGADCRM